MNMQELKKLLKDKRVIDEIQRHLWIESQKAGHSIGQDRATEEWLSNYAIDWLRYNEPKKYEKLVNKKKR